MRRAATATKVAGIALFNPILGFVLHRDLLCASLLLSELHLQWLSLQCQPQKQPGFLFVVVCVFFKYIFLN